MASAIVVKHCRHSSCFTCVSTLTKKPPNLNASRLQTGPAAEQSRKTRLRLCARGFRLGSKANTRRAQCKKKETCLVGVLRGVGHKPPNVRHASRRRRKHPRFFLAEAKKGGLDFPLTKRKKGLPTKDFTPFRAPGPNGPGANKAVLNFSKAARLAQKIWRLKSAEP